VRSTPRRIAVVGLTEQDTVLALGSKPIATTEWYGKQPHAVWPWARAALGKEAEGRALVRKIKARYAKAAAEYPEFKGKTITFSQNGFYFATEKPNDIAALGKAPTFGRLKAVAEHRAVFTDGVLTGAAYFMTR